MQTKLPEASEGRHNAGTVTHTARGYVAQFSLGHGERKSTLLRDCKSDDEAELRRATIAGFVGQLLEAGHRSMVPGTIREAGKLDAAGLRLMSKHVARVVAGKVPGLTRRASMRREGLTVAELAKAWTSGELAAEFPDHVKVKRTRAGDERRLEWLGKVRLPDGRPFGERAVSEVTLDDADHVMGALPKTTNASATRRHYAQSLRKLLAYAVYPLRLRESLPIPPGWLPKVKSDKAKSWVRPAEDRALLATVEVPLVVRLLFGVLAREGLRVSEALGLTWADVDLEVGTVRLDRNKTDDPRSWALGPDVARALAAWKALRGSKAAKVPTIFPKSLVVAHRLAQHLRDGLALAGVKRPELADDPGPLRIPLRAHDLRGSFVTLALANGRTEAWVTDRTGHKASTMLYRYKRASREAAELGLGWFVPLDLAIPELRPKGANGVQTGVLSSTERPRARSTKAEKSPRRGVSGPQSYRLKSAAREGVRVRPPEGPPASPTASVRRSGGYRFASRSA